jgi:hypothetical protein
VNKNKFFILVLFLFGVLYIEQMISLKTKKLEERILNLKEMILYKNTGKLSFVRDVDLLSMKRPIYLCGYAGSDRLIVEIIPLKKIRIWYGVELAKKVSLDPDEEWNYLLRDGHILSENEALSKGMVFRDEQTLYILGKDQFLSSEGCLAK